MKEKDFQSQFSKWLKYVYKDIGVFELKLCRGNSMAYSVVQQHQIESLVQAKHGTIVFKLPDVGYRNPFDCFCLSGVPAFLVVKYISGETYLVDIDKFTAEMKIWKRKSLTESRAKEIATTVIPK